MTGPHNTARHGLDWRNSLHWGGGKRLPCVHCHRGAFCRDKQGRPCHKTCAEAARNQHTEHRAGDDLALGRDAA